MGTQMWFDNDLRGGRRGGRSQSTSRGRPVLMVNARLRQEKSGWLSRVTVVALLLLTVSGLGFLAWVGVRQVEAFLFSKNDEYILTNRVINCESKRLKEYIEEQLPVKTGTNLFAFDIADIQRELEHTANIKEVEVRRRLPATLEVRASERIPIARLGHQNDRRHYLVMDDEGVVFLAGSRALADSLPDISGYGRDPRNAGDRIEPGMIADVVTFLDLCRTSQFGPVLQPARIDIRKECLDVKLADGGAVVSLRWRKADGGRKDSRGDLNGRLSLLSTIIAQYEKAGIPLRTVDLTLDDYARNCPTTPRLDRRE